MKGKKARVFWTGRSQAVCLPKEFRFDTDRVVVRREGRAVVMEPAHEWPDGYIESFAGVAEDFTRPPQGEVEKRAWAGITVHKEKKSRGKRRAHPVTGLEPGSA